MGIRVATCMGGHSKGHLHWFLYVRADGFAEPLWVSSFGSALRVTNRTRLS